MAFTIEDLQIEFESNDTSAAVSGIDALARSLERLKKAVGGDMAGASSNMNRIAAAMRNLKGVGELNLAPNVAQLKSLSGVVQTLAGVNGTAFESNMAAITRSLSSATTVQKGDFSTITNSVKKLVETVGGMDAAGISQFSSQMSTITTSLSGLSGIEKGSIGSVVSQLKQIPDLTKNLDIANLDNFSNQMEKIASGMSKLNAIEKGNLGSVINQLKKIPEVTQALDSTTMNQFSDSIRELTRILGPLATQMDSVSRGFSALPNRMRSTIAASNQVVAANHRTASSYNGLGTSITRTITKLTVLGFAFRRVVNVLSSALDESNDYIENLNLFTVTMGDATDSAMEFATTVQDLMGIDISQWIENQGVFMRMATGFGIASDQAQVMSQNLTQLAYDMSSFFNTDVQTAMQKLQSGMSGQIKGLKAWGYNLSVAALQETALSLGIEQSVRTMTEAQKAQLRYITLIQKSYGVMGDMGRTLVTPANALRILGSQFTQLKRAVGDVVSVIAVQFIPYVQVLVRVLTDAAKSLAAFFGFELPKIDYSSLEMGSDVIDGIGDGIEDTTKAAGDLKRQLMGFDELNVLKDPTAGAGDVKAGASYDLGVELPEYDFLAGLDSKTEEMTNKVKSFFGDIKDEFDKFEPLLAGVSTAFIGALGFNWIKNSLKKFAAIKGVQKILKALKLAAFQAGMQFNFTHSHLSAFGAGIASLWASFKAFMSGLSPMMKGLVSFIALTTEFVTVSSAIEDLTLGNISLGEALLNIVPVAGAAGVAMYAMLGPVGAVAAGVTAVAAAIYGWNDAENQLRAQLVESTFYDDQGTAISELATAYGNLMQKTVDAQQPILTAWSDIESGRDKIWETANSITNLGTQVELGYVAVSENIPLIVDEFNQLYNDTVDVLNQEASLIYTALAGSTGKALEDMGYNLEAVGLLISNVVGDTTKEIEALVEENKKLEESLRAGTAEDGAMATYLENAQEIARLSGVDTSGLDDFRDKVKNLIPDDINWETDDLTSVFDGIATSTGEAKTAIEESTQATIDALEHMKSLSVNPEDIKIFDDLIAAVTADKDNKLQEIENVAAEFVGGLQTNLIESIQDEYDAALENWDSLSWLSKTFKYGNNEAQYVEECLKTYNDNIVTPITDQMKESFSGALSDDTVWASDAMNSMLDALFDTENYTSASGNVSYSTKVFAKDVASALNEVLPPEMRTSGENAGAGIAEGLNNSTTVVSEAASGLGNTALDAFDTALDINSPSVEMAKRAGWMVDGLLQGMSDRQPDIDNAMAEMATAILEAFNIDANLKDSSKSMMNSLAAGITGNKYLVTTALDGLSRDMTSKFTSMANSCQKIMQNMVKNISSTLNGVNVSVSTTSTGARMRVAQYATGGYPVTGEMFIAREAGPELVGRIGSKTAVANNDQIVSGIAAGVHDANQDLISAAYAIGTQIITAIRENGGDVYLDGEKVANKVTSSQKQHDRMYG